MRFQAAFGHLEPGRIAVDLGLKVHSEGHLSFVDLSASERFWIHGDSFVTLPSKHPFVAGDIFDFLALKLGSYDAALTHVLTTYGDSVDPAVTKSLAEDVRSEAMLLDLKRQKFLHWLELGDNLVYRHTSYPRALSWMSAREIDPRYCHRMMFVCHGRELVQRTLLQADPPSFVENATYIVLPYFSNYHTLSSLQAVDTLTLKTTQIELRPAPIEFFGLLTAAPSCLDVRVAGTEEQSMFHYSRSCQQGHNNFGVVRVKPNGRVPGAALRLKSGVFLGGERAALPTVAQGRAGFSEYAVAVDNATAIPWADYALQEFQETFYQDRDLAVTSSRVTDILTEDPVVADRIKAWLEKHGRADLSVLLASRLAVSRKFTIEDVVVEEGESGYIYTRPGAKVPVLGTNFTLRLTSSVWFAQSGDLFHYGKLRCQGNEYDVRVSRQDLDKPHKLLETLGASVASSGKSFHPVFYDSTARRVIMCVLAEQLQHHTSTQGLMQLGWDEHRHTFYSTHWKAGVGGIAYEDQILHPNCESTLNHYQCSQVAKAFSTSLVGPAVRSFIALLISALTRSFAKQPFDIVTFEQSDASQKLLKALFLAFGQVQPIDLNMNKRAVSRILPAELAELPVLGTSAEIPESGQKGCIFALCPEGIKVTDVFTDDLFEQTYTLNQMICAMTCVALSRDAKSLTGLLHNNPTSRVDYIMEGKRIVEYVSGGSFAVLDNDMPHFYGMLSVIPTAQLPEYFAHFSSHAVRIDFSHIESHRRQDVCKELAAQHPATNMFKKHFILVNREFVMELLTRYYGATPELPTLSNESTA